MPASVVEGESLLAVDVGTTKTRALLFDVVEGRYRFIAAAQAPTTAEAPVKDIGEGVRQAVENLQTVTGRILLDADHRLVIPTQTGGSGVDAFAATLSAGPSLKAVIVGLLADVSLESVQRLAEGASARIVETISLNDRRKPEEQIDGIVRARPDMIIIAGGTDGGASRSIRKVLEVIGLACYLLPQDKRPAALFVGNQSLAEDVRSLLESLTVSLRISPNVRPSLEVEDLDPARNELARLIMDTRKRQMRGVEELNLWAGGHLMPTAHAEGRMVRFLSRVYGSAKGVLCVDVGAAGTTVAAGFNGALTLGVYPQFGLGENLPGLLRYTDLEVIERWLSLDIPQSLVRDFLHQQSLYPASLPATKEEQAIAQALARQVLHLALQAARRNFPPEVRPFRPGLLPLFEPILACGGVITEAPTPGQSLLLLLDALQPVGITTLILDQNNLLPVLGAAAERNNILPVQVIESGALINLATVISPVSSVRHGMTILRARLIYDDGSEIKAEVKAGGLEVLPLASGKTARLQLQPLHRTDTGLGIGRGGTIRVSGSVLGMVIDARGRPLDLPSDPVQRRELIKKWLWTVGG